MSATEIIHEIERLAPTERREVEAYFRHRIRAADPAWQAELARRIDDARAGRALGSNEIRALIAQVAT